MSLGWDLGVRALSLNFSHAKILWSPRELGLMDEPLCFDSLFHKVVNASELGELIPFLAQLMVKSYQATHLAISLSQLESISPTQTKAISTLNGLRRHFQTYASFKFL